MLYNFIKKKYTENNELIIKGEIKPKYDNKIEKENSSQNNYKFRLNERFYGSFERKFKLPKNINKTKENVNAKLEDGILTIDLPKQINNDTNFFVDIQ